MLKRRLILVCMALLAVGSWAMPSAHAQSISDPAAAAFIQKLGSETINTFADKKLSREQAVEHFRTLLNQGFDVPTIGRFVVGRYWNQATPQQQQEYLKLFEQLIVKTYANRFIDYSGETFKIAGTTRDGDNDTFVTTQILRPQGPPVAVDWRVRHRGDSYKIIDVVVEGVSMGITQRNEFASIIQQGGGRFEALIDALKKHLTRNG